MSIKKMPKNFIVCYRDHWSTYVSREFHYLLTAMEETWGWTVLRAPHWTEAFEMPGNTVCFFECYPLVQENAQRIQAYPGNKFFFTDDAHWFEEGTRIMKTNCWKVFRTMICTNSWSFYRVFPEYTDTHFVLNLPHCACDDFVRDMNPDPKPRALLSGYLHSSYPMRMAAFYLATEGGAKGVMPSPLPLDYLWHPGYKGEFEHLAKRYDKFAEALWSYLVCVTDGGIFDYVLAKNFEIPAVYALLLTQDTLRPRMATYGFIEGEHCLFYNNTEEMASRIRWACDPANREEVDRIRKNGGDLIRHRHTTRHRAEQLHNQLVNTPS